MVLWQDLPSSPSAAQRPREFFRSLPRLPSPRPAVHEPVGTLHPPQAVRVTTDVRTASLLGAQRRWASSRASPTRIIQQRRDKVESRGGGRSAPGRGVGAPLFPHCRVLAPWPLPRVPPHQGLQGSSGAVRAECKKAASLTGARRREAQQKYQMRGTNLSGFETGRVTMRHQAGPRFVWTLVRHSRRWTKQTEH